jgi:alkanesulfonate monooxygenase SsuD/methylene tetrahydromethanopterin reductase-like flavin-dependent oxidoreductase (luciferase family)
MSGEQVDFRGRFFELSGAIRPAPTAPIPVLVGGRSDAALARAGQLAEGWLALWVSPRRFAEAIGRIGTVADEAGRGRVHWQHALQLWAGFGTSRARARARVRVTMEEAYSLPFERFERYVPCGPPEVVAAALAPYLAAGCRRFNFVPEADGLEAAIEAVGEVKALLPAAPASTRAQPPRRQGTA